MFVLESIAGGKSLGSLKEMGGIDGLAGHLKSDKKTGIVMDKQLNKKRKSFYGSNKPQVKKQRTFLEMVWEALEDTTLRILIIAALVSLIVGIWEDPEEGWLEGVAILIAVVIVVLVTSVNNYIKEKQFRKLNQEASERLVTAFRAEGDNKEAQISVFKLLVGDLIKIGAGDILPVDAIVVHANQLVLNESSVTGESKPLKKGYEHGETPFLLSGSQVEEGSGTAIVVAVGKHSFQGKNLELMQVEEEEETPLQQKLNRIAEGIGKIGLIVALLTFGVLIIYLVVETVNDGWDSSKSFSKLVSSFIIAITIVVVAVPEGLPLAVTLSLAYSVGQMKKKNNLVRHLDASETMGQATAICSDKTGTLTKNIMEVTAIYTEGKKIEKIEVSEFSKEVRDLLVEHFCHNTTASIGITVEKDNHGKEKRKETFTGSRTEIALLKLASKFGANYTTVRDIELLSLQVPFSSKLKRMETVLKKGDGYIVLVKGASETVLGMCNKRVGPNGSEIPISHSELKALENDVISDYASRALRTLTLAYKHIDKNFPIHNENGDANMDELEKDLTLLAICGIEDPLRDEVPHAVDVCQKAGITIRMVTGDNRETAVAIARKCNILAKSHVDNEGDDTVMLGSEFRERVKHLKDEPSADGKSVNKVVGDLEEFKRIVSKLRVLSRSSPEDKFILVTGLRQLGEIVAVTGDGSNDAPALKKSNVGFAMHEAGTQLAQEASDIVLLDDNFASIVTAILWGRNIYDCISKFIQFQLTVNVVALILSFIGAAITETSPLTAVQMLWVNLIMDTFAALALATEPPHDSLLDRKPNKTSDSLITPDMMKNIIGQSIYQSIWLLIILFAGNEIFGVPSGFETKEDWSDANGVHFTIFFNAFVFMQVFNEINCRKLKASELNVFKGFFNNWIFLFIVFATIIVQILLVQFGGEPVRCAPLTLTQHLICIGIGIGGLFFGILVRLVPSAPFKCFKISEEPLTAIEADKGVTGLMRRKTTRKIHADNSAIKG